MQAERRRRIGASPRFSFSRRHWLAHRSRDCARPPAKAQRSPYVWCYEDVLWSKGRRSAAAVGALAGQLGNPGGVAAQLGDRELQIFRPVGLALPTRNIADKLGVSIKTVEAHRENIKNQLGLESGAALTARAAHWINDSERT